MIKASVRGLRTCADINRLEEEWIALSDGFWGHPGVLTSIKDAETYMVYSNLYISIRVIVGVNHLLDNVSLVTA